MIAALFDFLFTWMPESDGLKGIVFLAGPFFGGLFAAIWFKPTAARFLLGLLAIALAYVVDVILSVNVALSLGLAMDQFHMDIELILYGIITIGWLIGATISGLIRKDRHRDHPRCDTTTDA